MDFMTLSQRASMQGEVLLGGLGAWLSSGLRLARRGEARLLEARQGEAKVAALQPRASSKVLLVILQYNGN